VFIMILRVIIIKVIYFVIKGNWKAGRAEGNGLLSFNKSRYEGSWERNILKTGRANKEDGSVFEGTFEDDFKYLNGEVNIPNKPKFSEIFKEGQVESGTGIFNLGMKTYDGNITGGKISGKGKLKYDNMSYTGEFKDGMLYGEGTFIWEDGQTYIGSWVNNKMQGSGKLNYPRSGSCYEGEFNDNKRHGYGTYFWNVSKYYRGEWFNNTPHGEGVIVNNNQGQSVLYRFGKKVSDPHIKQETIDDMLNELNLETLEVNKIEYDNNVSQFFSKLV
jgi:hypothetical protein